MLVIETSLVPVRKTSPLNCLASSFTMAKPIPLFEPVTTATLIDIFYYIY